MLCILYKCKNVLYTRIFFTCSNTLFKSYVVGIEYQLQRFIKNNYKMTIMQNIRVDGFKIKNSFLFAVITSFLAFKQNVI